MVVKTYQDLRNPHIHVSRIFIFISLTKEIVKQVNTVLFHFITLFS